jgi:hypothetical protein
MLLRPISATQPRSGQKPFAISSRHDIEFAEQEDRRAMKINFDNFKSAAEEDLESNSLGFIG